MSDAGLIVVKAGVATTVQDLGRPGYRGFGVPIGGAFDRGSFDLANALLGNQSGDAALELAVLPGVYQATSPLALAVTGAPFVTWVRGSDGDRPINVPSSFTMESGDQLIFGPSRVGVRGYLAVAGGWQTPVVLGSRSSEVSLVDGDFLPARPTRTMVRRPVDPPLWIRPIEQEIRVIDGPDREVPQGLSEASWRVTPESNRVGLRLNGPKLDGFIDAGRRSAPLAPGAIQLADGQPLIIGVAGGTMGGYPHVAHVISTDLDLLAQVQFGMELKFVVVSLTEAVELDWTKRKLLLERDRWIRLGSQCIDA